VAALLFCGISHRTKWTIVNGRIAVDNGRLVQADERELAERANRASRDLLEKSLARL
jgi:hypothetical protein